MDAKHLKVGLPTILPLLLSVGTIMGVYFTLEGKVTVVRGDVQRLEKYVEKEHNTNKAQFKEVRLEDKGILKAISDLRYDLIKEIRHENTDSHGR